METTLLIVLAVVIVGWMVWTQGPVGRFLDKGNPDRDDYRFPRWVTKKK